MAEKKSRQAIRKIKKISPNSILVFTGCYAQLRSEELAQIPEIDLVLGAKDKFRILDRLRDLESGNTTKIFPCKIETISKYDAAYSVSGRTRSFLKVQDGCDYFCTYCTIPYARGKSRNDSIENIVKQAKEIAKQGYKEIILTGVNTGDFGKSTKEKFIDLIRKLDKLENIYRYRISSIEPNLLTDEIIEFVANSKTFLPHFHIPLQSGCNKTLKAMGRRYKRELFAEKIQKIKKEMPDAFIGVDVICGFPGETDNDFQETYRFLEKLDISFLHTFSYSVRPGTKAEKIPHKVMNRTITERSKLLAQLSNAKHRKFCLQNKNKVKSVLFEFKNKENMLRGFTENYIRVEIPFDEKLINSLTNVKLISLNSENIFSSSLLTEN